MSPSGLLSAWRERWRKPRGAELHVPYRRGAVVHWLDRARNSHFWTLPGAGPLALAGVLLFLVLTPQAGLTLNGQILYAALLLGFAALLRRYAGPVCALSMVSLSLMATTRYLAWRLLDTLPVNPVDLAWGLLLWATEALLALAWMLRLASHHGPADPQPGWRQRAQGLRQALVFYAPLARALAVATPLLCLGLGLAPVLADPAHLLAYGLPHLLLVQMANQAQDREGRLSSTGLWREWLLEGVILWRTARACVQTQLRYLAGRWWPASRPGLADVSLGRAGWLTGGLLVLHALVLVPLWRHPPSASAWHDTLLPVYLLWAGSNVLAALARLALAKETALVSREAARRATQDVLLTLGPGRLARARTANFPEPLLQLDWLPAPARMPGTGDRVSISVLHRGREHTFEAEVRAGTGKGLTLAIAATDLSDYQAFGAAVYSREAGWPGWLPARRADQILPDWAHRLAAAAESVFYDFVIARRGLRPWVQKLQAWLRPGTQHHG